MNIPDSPQARTILIILQILIIVVGGGIAWGTMQSDLKEQRTTTVRLEQLINSQNVGALSREARISALELGAGRTDERLLSILSILARIERQLESSQRP